MSLPANIVDARGNEFLGSLDQIGGGTVTDARVSSATLGAANAEIVMDLNGQAVANFDVRTAAGNLTLVFEATTDGTNYFGLPGFAISSTLGATVIAEQFVVSVVIATTAASSYIVGVSGFRRVRCRVSAYTSGNVVVSARASRADFAIYNRPIPSILHVTATGTSGSAVTATLPLVTGLFHYITKIHLIQFVVAARTAAATPVLATTTNLPGTPVYSCDATVGAVGAIFQYDLAPMTGNPLKSLVVGTNTTFVGPATTSTIWRWNISYYVGA
jgi:hypothetical protein